MEINNKLRKKLVSSFVNVLLVLTVLIILFPICSQPAKALTIRHDDWEVFGTESHIGETFILYGDLYIRDGGSLTLDNCIIEMAYEDPDNGSKIEVEGLGTFNVLNNSLITTNSTSPDPYEFRIDGAALIENSTVEKMKDIYGSFEDGIRIYSDYVEIRNSTIQLSNGTGVYIKDGEVLITNSNIIDNHNMGVYFDNVNDCSLLDCNNISSNGNEGIYIVFSSNINITGNNISNNYNGVAFYESSNIKMINSSFTNNGIIISGTQLLNFNSHYIPTNNVVNGKPLYYYRDSYGVNIDGIPVGQLILVNCSNFDVKNLNIDHTYVGIEVAHSMNSNITHNNISNTSSGIFLISSSNINIANNNASFSGTGINLIISSNNKIIGNKVTNNLFTGIRQSSSNGSEIAANTASNNNICGIRIVKSSENNIINNTASSNKYYGIMLDLKCDKNKVGGNNVSSNNRRGIYLDNSCNSSLITNNHIANNTNYALYISSSNNNEIIDNDLEYSNYGAFLTSSNNNILYHNNIKNNLLNNASDDGTNQWDNGLEGNWWGNNTNPTDSDGNGICDAEFYGTGFVDNYPLANEDNDRILVDDPWFWFIQSGINFADPGMTVYATSSTYLENVTINKTLTVIGEDRNSTIIDGRGNDSVVLVDGTSYVNITGFTATGSGSNVNDAGVELNNTQNCKITDNNISNNYFGVYVENSSNIIIENNIMSYNHDGVLSSYSSVIIQYNDISYNYHEGIGNINYSTAFIGNNTITHNVADGIAEIYYSNATIDNNTISYNDVGIVCGETPQIITYNNITNNRIGIDCWWSNSTIHWNNIHNNTVYGVNNLNPSIMVNAENNWWGNSTGPRHPSNPGGSGDRVSDYVDYDPWETAPIDEAGPG